MRKTNAGRHRTVLHFRRTSTCNCRNNSDWRYSTNEPKSRIGNKQIPDAIDCDHNWNPQSRIHCGTAVPTRRNRPVARDGRDDSRGGDHPYPGVLRLRNIDISNGIDRQAAARSAVYLAYAYLSVDRRPAVARIAFSGVTGYPLESVSDHAKNTFDTRKKNVSRRIHGYSKRRKNRIRCGNGWRGGRRSTRQSRKYVLLSDGTLKREERSDEQLNRSRGIPHNRPPNFTLSKKGLVAISICYRTAYPATIMADIGQLFDRRLTRSDRNRVNALRPRSNR